MILIINYNYHSGNNSEDDSDQASTPSLFGGILCNNSIWKTTKIFLDSGYIQSIIHDHLFDKSSLTHTKEKKLAGNFEKNYSANITLKLPELSHSAKINIHSHVTKQKCQYNTNLGRETLNKLGMILNFENKLIS